MRYRRPAGFDDLLSIRVRVDRVTGVRIDHAYEVRRGNELLAEATTTLACIDREGRPRALPDFCGTVAPQVMGVVELETLDPARPFSINALFNACIGSWFGGWRYTIPGAGLFSRPYVAA